MNKFDGYSAPIDQQHLTWVAGAIRVLIGLLLIGYSAVSTVYLLGNILIALRLTDNLLVAWAAAFVFAGGVTLAEWAFKDGVTWAIVLTLDAPFTAVQTFMWVGPAVADYGYASYNSIIVSLWHISFSLILGVLAARLGEVLLLNRKKSYDISNNHGTGKRGRDAARMGDVRGDLRGAEFFSDSGIYQDTASAGYRDDRPQQRSDNQRRKR